MLVCEGVLAVDGCHVNRYVGCQALFKLKGLEETEALDNFKRISRARWKGPRTCAHTEFGPSERRRSC